MDEEIQLLLARAGGVTEQEFQRVIGVQRDRLESAASIVSTELAWRVVADDLGASAQSAASGDSAVAWDTILTVRGKAGKAGWSDALQGLSRQPAIDRERSAIAAGQRHTILAGHAPIRLFFALRRLPHLEPSAFHDYWLNRHAPIGRRLIPPYSYHQIHVTREASDRASHETGFPNAVLDGIVEVHFPDLAAFRVQLARPEVAAEAFEDEKNFIDHARSAFAVYRN